MKSKRKKVGVIEVELDQTPTALHLVSCLRNSLTKSSDTGEDLISGFGPDKGLGIVVSEFDILFDGLFQLQRAAMSRSFDLPFGEQTKPPFH